ncbi:MAG: TolB family protein [Planctomycetota bacterium]|jgi:hypothetical protein
MLRRFIPLIATLSLTGAGCVTSSVQAQDDDWAAAEHGVLANHVQLTFADRFAKAGEAYFSPDDSRIIFQAVEVPPDGEAADPFYAMFVADVVRDAAGRIAGIDNIRRLSPPGSANTCGWFHPTDPNVVIFGSTVSPPTDQKPPGFERLSGRYRWMFPPEMKIVRCPLDQADGTAESLEIVLGDDRAYQAECTLSRDGRHLLYTSLSTNRGDLYVRDLQSKPVVTTRIVQSQAYDGGPFFSPDGRRICYRADRGKQHYLELFVADLAFNEQGSIVGIEREYQLTDNERVNWGPYWHPNGRYLVYATGEMGHHNYEVFLMDADPGDLPGSTGTIRYSIRKRRVTHAGGADVLPAFSSDGRTLIWTSQRGAGRASQVWAADFVMELERKRSDDADDQSH